VLFKLFFAKEYATNKTLNTGSKNLMKNVKSYFLEKKCIMKNCQNVNSESKTAFNIFGSKIKEWWDRDQILEDQVKPLTFVANTSESSSEFDSDDDYVGRRNVWP
jgi:hypothetical protein